MNPLANLWSRRLSDVEHIAAFAIPCANGQARTAGRGNHAAGGERRIVEEALVGIDFDVFRMIDRDEAQLVDVVHLFHRLDEAQAQLAVHRGELCAVNLDPFARSSECCAAWA